MTKGMQAILVVWAVTAGTAAFADSLQLESSDVLSVSKQELGVRFGLAAGGDLAPGGAHISGNYLYRLSAVDWFEAEAAFTYGGGDRGCVEAESFQCDHGLVGGSAISVTAGVRRFFSVQGRFHPFAKLGLSFRTISFSADEVRGIAVPLVLGGGVRARVGDRVAVVGGATAQFGPAWFNHGFGLESQFVFVVTGGVEFSL